MHVNIDMHVVKVLICADWIGINIQRLDLCVFELRSNLSNFREAWTSNPVVIRIC